MTDAPVTIIIPTHDHAATLPYAISSVLGQTYGDLDLVVIGDGVGDATRDVVADARRRDRRVSFVDRPKSVRHAEEVRHEVIAATGATVIGYHGDDDLLLPWHVQEMLALLGDRDFVHPLPIRLTPDGTLHHLPTDLSRPECLAWHRDPEVMRNAVSLTGVVHTRASYLRLPDGWHPAPADEWTDLHMWRQYFALPGLRAATASCATTVKLDTALRGGLAPVERTAEIRQWSERMADPGFRVRWDSAVAAAVRRAAVDREIAMASAHEQIRQLQQRADADRVAAQRALDHLKSQRDQARHEVTVMADSRSWRLSQPLRRAAAALRRER